MRLRLLLRRVSLGFNHQQTENRRRRILDFYSNLTNDNYAEELLFFEKVEPHSSFFSLVR
jgi:hemerythrin superfamily protein